MQVDGPVFEEEKPETQGTIEQDKKMRLAVITLDSFSAIIIIELHAFLIPTFLLL
jgi:hypothetical protein